MDRAKPPRSHSKYYLKRHKQKTCNQISYKCSLLFTQPQALVRTKQIGLLYVQLLRQSYLQFLVLRMNNCHVVFFFLLIITKNCCSTKSRSLVRRWTAMLFHHAAAHRVDLLWVLGFCTDMRSSGTSLQK